jgi:hypothetical protein
LRPESISRRTTGAVVAESPPGEERSLWDVVGAADAGTFEAKRAKKAGRAERR